MQIRVPVDDITTWFVLYTVHAPDGAPVASQAAIPDEAGMPEDPHPLPPPTATFARDAERHLLDAPRHGPRCGAAIAGPDGLVVEYWAADDRVFYCWCRSCDWTGTVVQVDRHIGHEAADWRDERAVTIPGRWGPRLPAMAVRVAARPSWPSGSSGGGGSPCSA